MQLYVTIWLSSRPVLNGGYVVCFHTDAVTTDYTFNNSELRCSEVAVSGIAIEVEPAWLF